MPPLSSKEKSGQGRDRMWRSISGSSGVSTTQIGSEETAVGFVAEKNGAQQFCQLCR